jgi:hypothetical protein
MIGMIVLIVFVVGVVWMLQDSDNAAGCGIMVGIALLIGVGSWVWGWGWDRYQAHHLAQDLRLSTVIAQSDTFPESANAAPSSRLIGISGILDNNNAQTEVDSIRLRLDIRHCARTQRFEPVDCGPIVEQRMLKISGSNRSDRVGDSYPDLVQSGERVNFVATALVTNVPQGKVALGAVTIDRACTDRTSELCSPN